MRTMRTILRRKLRAPLAIALLIGVAALSLYLSSGADGREGAFGSDARTIVSPPRPESAVPRSEGDEAATTLARSPVEPSIHVAPLDLLATDMATVTGRCVDEASQPLRGCVVSIERVTTVGGVRVRPETRVETDALGVFTVLLRIDSDAWRKFTVSAAERTSRTKLIERFEAGQVVDLGDIRLPLGTTVRGVVLATDGTPVRAAKLMWSLVSDHAAPTIGAAGDRMDPGGLVWAMMITDAGGRFEASDRLARGMWQVSLPDAGVASLQPPRIALAEPTAEVEFRAALLPRITGRIVDGRGMPVSGLGLQAADARSRVRRSAVGGIGGVSAGDGSFVLVQDQPGAPDESVRVILWPGYETETKYALQEEPLVPWGAAVVIVVEEKPTLDLTVLDADNGQPIEAYAVSLQPDRRLSWQGDGAHAGGKYHVVPQTSGASYLLSIVATGGAQRPVAWQSIALHGETALTVHLPKSRSFRVHVSDQNGRPIGGAEVAVVISFAAADEQSVIDARAGFEPRNIFGYRGVGPVAFSRAFADAAGDVRVMVPDGIEGAYHLRVRAAGTGVTVLPIRHDDLAREDWTIVLGAGGVVKGRVAADRERLRGIAILLREALPAGPRAANPPRAVALDPDGSFKIENAGAGTWVLVATTAERGATLGPVGSPFEVVPGQTTRLDEIVFDGPWPAALAGAVTVGGNVPRAATIAVRAAGGDAVAAEVAVDERGEWHASGLVPGSYDITLRVGRVEHRIADGVRVASAASLRVDRQL